MVNTKRFWKNRSVLLTGGDGIVGSWLIKALLSAGAKVVALIYDHNTNSELYLSGDVHRIKVVDGRLEDISVIRLALTKYKIESVFHLGAQAIVGTAWQRPLDTFESNIRGTYNLLEACRLTKSVRRIVVASSDKAYGEHTQLPYTEEMSLQGRFPYEVSKSCTDLLAQSYYYSYGLPVAIVRCGNIYGGGDLHFSRIVSGTILSFLNGQAPIIRSDGKFVRDYIYVKDVCHAYMLVAQGLADKKLWGESFNCSNEEPMTVLALVKAISQMMGCSAIKPKILNQVHGEIRKQFLSSAKIQRLLKWRAQYSLTQGLSETVDWYRTFVCKSF